MKNQLKILLLSSFFGFSVALFSISHATEEFSEACYENMELGNFLFSIASGGAQVDADAFTQSERAELMAVVNDPQLAEATVQEKIKAGYEACSRGDVLSERHSALTDQ